VVRPTTIADRREAGRACRGHAPLAGHADAGPAPETRDPIAFLEEQAASRQANLVPIRHGRMADNPFGFLRGAALVQAHDLAPTPTSGLTVQLCGDAHIRNFGKFATPERNVVFSINDFDETLPGPFEWDVKRLAASLHLVAQQNRLSPKKCDNAVLTTLRSYRERMAGYAAKSMLDIWYDHTALDDVICHFDPRDRQRVAEDAAKAARKDQRKAVARYTHNGDPRFVDDPPLVVHLDATGQTLTDVLHMLDDYKESLRDDRRVLVDRYELVDVAHRVGGVGSVGTRCWIVLMAASDRDGDRLILQVKQAQPSVLERFVGASTIAHPGRRVVAGQRLCQGATDIFLGWCEHEVSGRTYYVRQLWDLKGRSDLTLMNARNLTYHGALCGWALARAHARSGDPVAICGYLGRRDTFDRAVLEYAKAYVRTTELDHQRLVDAVRDGRVEAVAGI
jgi:uncharacterized protein (DUF2252 family)